MIKVFKTLFQIDFWQVFVAKISLRDFFKSNGKTLKKRFDYIDIYDVRKRLVKENSKVFSVQNKKIDNDEIKVMHNYLKKKYTYKDY